MTVELDDATIAALCTRASEAHPDIAFDRAAFEACLRRAAVADDSHLDDLYLADACSRGDQAGLRIFDRSYGRDIDRAIAKSPKLGLSADEFRQLVRERLFVAQGDRLPRIAAYLGRGTLRSWVRVTVSRLVIDIARQRRADEPRPPDELARRLPSAADPELDILRHAYGAALPAAFEQAVTRLSVRQRNLLRQRHLHSTTVERLAAMYDVHRSTMFVWLGEARDELLAAVRETLAVTLGSEDIDSVVAVLGSQLHVSIRRMLGSRIEEE